MRQHLKQMKNEKGMTLVELLAVLVIIGIIAAIAIPMIGNIIQNSKDKAILSDAQMILSAAKIAYSNNEGTKETKTEGDKTTETGAIVFDHKVLQPYVDGVTLGPNDKVVYNNKEWTITYSKLEFIKNENYKKAISSNSITAKKLSTLLKGE
ncbi:type II secretion system protein [Caldifermentibacillus hisashii]|uniref:type II secretion system protein n=1 Tax=Caldifermentibacillus hisashii TaxID=996558 RepID=UPI002AC33A02|nr:prepilin-type N-terminal cleavage/methylation domain-containing protein [Caldifermentibacillus hisashii]